ncbi:MFS transporter [Streptomyces sp. NPDC093018]|uniref:MFS transporter n=1 Tax=Streptomyces sp. NPDC093018 TaxID=3155067 RepID=UPI0034247279
MVEKWLRRAMLADSVGNGLFFTGGSVYFLRVVGLSPRWIGLGFTASAVAALLCATPLGYAADRFTPRKTLTTYYTAEGIFALTMLGAHSVLPFVLLVMLSGAAAAGSRGARGGFIALAVAPDRRVAVRARLRTTANMGTAVGAVLGGAVMAAPDKGWLVLVVVGNGASFLIAACCVLRTPTMAARRVPAKTTGGRGPGLVSLRDPLYLGVSALDGILQIHFAILEIGLPLWIARYTTAPLWLISGLVITNSALVIIFQARISKLIHTVARAGSAALASSAFLAAACGLIALSSRGAAAFATACLCIGALLHVAGEILQSSASWTLSFDLAPEQMQGQYQATFSMGGTAAKLVGPGAVTLLMTGLGAAGWLVAGLGFLLTGALVPTAVRRAGQRPALVAMVTSQESEPALGETPTTGRPTR